jgi:hypothetical protein
MSFQRPLSGVLTAIATVSSWPVSDRWLEGSDWSVGGSFAMVADPFRPFLRSDALPWQKPWKGSTYNIQTGRKS